jgi:hypothetical protein
MELHLYRLFLHLPPPPIRVIAPSAYFAIPVMAALLRRKLTVDELEEMFSEFVVEQLVVDRRLLVNRQNLKKMYRVWYQGRFRKRREGEEFKDAKNEEGVGERGEGEEGVRDVDEAIEG